MTALDPADEDYGHRARRGEVALLLRTGFVQVATLGGQVTLARYLSPRDFGAFAILQTLATLSSLLGDGGLGVALIQQREKPDARDLSTVFFAQLGAGAFVVALALLLGPHAMRLAPDLPADTPTLVALLALAFVLSALRTVPSLLLERELHFERIALLDAVNQSTFFIAASIAAVFGWGLTSLVIGVLAQAGLACAVAFALRPWHPSFVFAPERVRTLLTFGLPYQARGAITLAMSALCPVVLGSRFGAETVGLINWAHQNGFFAFTFVNILAQVHFPLFSRLQSRPEELEAALERVLRLGTLVTCAIALLWVTASRTITLAVFGDQWLPAVPYLEVYAAALIGGIWINLLAPMFDALGRPRVAFAQALLVAAVTWVITPIATRAYGIPGYLAAYLGVMAVGGVAMLLLAKQAFRGLPLTSLIGAPVSMAFAVGCVGRVLELEERAAPVSLAGALTSLAVWLALTAWVDRPVARLLHQTLRRSTPSRAGERT